MPMIQHRYASRSRTPDTDKSAMTDDSTQRQQVPPRGKLGGASSCCTSGRDGVNHGLRHRPMLLLTALLLAAFCFLHVLVSSIRTESNSLEKSKSKSCLTFVGDTMLASADPRRRNYTEKISHPREAFKYVRPLLRRCSSIVANLEGPVTQRGGEHDPKHQKSSFSFNMDPDVLPELLKEEGIGYLNMGNNHLLDRGQEGARDTIKYLGRAGLKYFGVGTSEEKAAAPLVVTLPSSSSNDKQAGNSADAPTCTVGITSFSQYYSRGIHPVPSDNFMGVLTVEKDHVDLGRRMLDVHSADIRIALVHFGGNYKPVSEDMRHQAQLLAEGGYDMIVGSAGSHTVQEFDYLTTKGGKSVPVLYNIGNFLFQTPGRFASLGALPYGVVAHVLFDVEAKRVSGLELHCTFVDNKKVHLRPLPCTGDQATELFETLGPHIEYAGNQTFATARIDREWNAANFLPRIVTGLRK